MVENRMMEDWSLRDFDRSNTGDAEDHSTRGESRSRKSAQGVKWSFCLTAGKMARELGGTMSRRARRTHTPAFKAKVAVAAIKGELTLAQRRTL